MVQVLIAITNIVGRHPLNQARLASLATPLLESLASLLQSLPLPGPISGDTSRGTVTVPDSDPSPPLSARPTMDAVINMDESQAEGNIPIEVHSQARNITAKATGAVPQETGNTAAAVSVCRFQLDPVRPASALTAQLTGAVLLPAGALTHNTTSAASAAAADVRSTASAADTAAAAAADADADADASTTIAPVRADQAGPRGSHDLPGQSTPHTPRAASASSQQHESQHGTEIRLAKQFVYHVLMLLPAVFVRQRAGFWMENAAGLPDLLRCCIAVAVLQDPVVSYCCFLLLLSTACSSVASNSGKRV